MPAAHGADDDEEDDPLGDIEPETLEEEEVDEEEAHADDEDSEDEDGDGDGDAPRRKRQKKEVKPLFGVHKRGCRQIQKQVCRFLRRGTRGG